MSLLNTFRSRHRRKDEVITFYASEALLCPRYIYFNHTRGRILLNKKDAEEGKAVHKVIQQNILERRSKVKVEVPVRLNFKFFRVLGRADVYDVAEGIVIEIKSVRALPDMPRRRDVAQLTIYMASLNAEGAILYVERGMPLKFRIFHVNFVPRIFRDVIANFTTAYSSLRLKRPPPPRKDGLCVFCPHKDECMGLPHYRFSGSDDR